MEYDLRQDDRFEPIFLMQREYPHENWATVGEFRHKHRAVADRVLEALRAPNSEEEQ